MTSSGGTYGFRTRPVVGEAELNEIERFRVHLRQIPELMERWQVLSETEPHPNSDLRLDDRATEGRHLTGGVHFALNFASDNLRALHQQHSGDTDYPTPFVASYPLARAALEASSLALWVLHPDEREDRIRNHLRNYARELYEETVLRKFALKQASEARDRLKVSGAVLGKSEREFERWKKRHNSRVADHAARAGIPNPMDSRRVGYGEIVADATAAVGLPPSHGELVWMEVSGLTHPSLMRAMSTMKIEQQSDNDDGTINVVMTSKTDTIATAVRASVLNYMTAIDLYGRRIRDPETGRAH
ncbi:hypothetical protein [Herbiconiux sp. VKM Ac-2851]|uniref:hypothetical protein n=1 Tax=Herbiconiux sp. VKM Ac-2851 TaxID=2739025 RepID=UPI001565B1BC|nr:hypothetical protein [Herbiconiux sp. VKM Ac-2851]NQX34722.1 hypothetical protein [Herbiconiux sp. VKM Ac-2851]